MKVYIEAAGCDRRQLDTESIRSYLEANGYELVSDPSQADRILAVTCAFKKKEEDESIRRLRSLRRYGKDILVYGCLADIAAGRYQEFDEIPSTNTSRESRFPSLRCAMRMSPRNHGLVSSVRDGELRPV
jgi:tRNA A37 methylthiotransferase MiaB